MAKFFGSNGVKTVDITGARTGVTNTINADKNGFFEARTAMDAKALKQAGFAEASLLGVAVGEVGYPCGNCGFNSFFVVCGRCGTNNKVEVADVTKGDCDCDNCDCEEQE